MCDELGNCFKFKQNNWSSISKLLNARMKSAGIMLRNGTWWVTGGSSEGGELLATTELLQSNQDKGGKELNYQTQIYIYSV